MKTSAAYIEKALQNDNVYVTSKIESMEKLTGLPSRKGLEQAVICEGEIVNVVSSSYGHLPNEKFFAEVEAKLIGADVNYKTRSINRNNGSFAVDYILDDERYIVKIKSGADEIVPMLRFVNSYDGTNKTSGHFGFFRKVCANGLHVAHSKIGFSAKHRGSIVEVVLPEISTLITKFFENEYYTLSKKFEVLAETKITDLEEFVRLTATDLKLFKYESSEKNPEPSLNARLVMDTIRRESSVLGEAPNLWLGYNALNEILHDKFKKSFEQQKALDSKIFERVLEFAN